MHLEKTMDTCYEIYEIYEGLLDSYVSDYYVGNHWSKLPASWQQHFSEVNFKQLSNLLDFEKPMVTSKLLPLSLMCLRLLISKNTLPRAQQRNLEVKDGDPPKFFWKSVKTKKKHEISLMAETCYNSAVKTNCNNVVDVGSGLGHLSRLLSYQYGLNVCTFEADEYLSSSAIEMDKNFERLSNKKYLHSGKKVNTVHVNQIISPHMSKDDFFELVRCAFGSECDVQFGLVGLHPCGELGSTLLRLYRECPNIVFLNMASCCYMKMNMVPAPSVNFPLSIVGKDLGIKLSYLSCEIACHAIENYVEKLKNPRESCELKIHAYRAGLEKLLVDINPKLKHSRICSVKYSEGLSFYDYVKKNTESLNVSVSDIIITKYANEIENTWEKVVAFYSLRLFLAPMVETIILLDRLLYAKESGIDCDLVPLFDCNISPRNHVLIARKYNRI